MALATIWQKNTVNQHLRTDYVCHILYLSLRPSETVVGQIVGLRLALGYIGTLNRLQIATTISIHYSCQTCNTCLGHTAQKVVGSARYGSGRILHGGWQPQHLAIRVAVT